MSATETPNDNRLTRYWPFAAVGLGAPPLAEFVSRWMPFYLAEGTCMFVGFAAAAWVFQRGSARLRCTVGRSLATSLASGLAAGAVTGVLAFLLRSR
jgi:hypothetical protein